MTQLAERLQTEHTPRPAAAATRQRRSHRTRRLLIVDTLLFVLFLLTINVPLTGLAIHEWLSIALAVGIVTHLLQHGDWAATIRRRLSSSTSLQNRLNFLMMIGLFFGFGSIIISGLLISEAALPWIGYTPNGGAFWFWLHLSSVGWVVALFAIHIAMNWTWIVNTTERLIFSPLRRVGGRSW